MGRYIVTMSTHAAKKRNSTAVTQVQLDVANAQKATADAQEQARQLHLRAEAHVNGIAHQAHIRSEEYQFQIEALQAQLRAAQQAAASAAEPAAAMDTDSSCDGAAPSSNRSAPQSS